MANSGGRSFSFPGKAANASGWHFSNVEFIHIPSLGGPPLYGGRASKGVQVKGVQSKDECEL